MTEFKVDAIYMRTKIHDRYGGQRQVGISVLTGYPMILLFEGMLGKQHGYENGFQPDGSFLYYGQGQRGDMKLTGANLKLANHSKYGKSLHLFQSVGSGIVRYKGEFYCEKYYCRKAEDTDGNLRRAIVFELRPISEIRGKS